MNTQEIIRKIIRNHLDSKDSYLSKALAVLSYRPFNMKGQEIEEIVGLLMFDGLKNDFPDNSPLVRVPQNKKTADIEFVYEGETKSFDIKSYGGAERFQLSTLKHILQDIRDKFNGSEERILSVEEKKWLIEKINLVTVEYNLSSLVTLEKKS